MDNMDNHRTILDNEWAVTVVQRNPAASSESSYCTRSDNQVSKSVLSPQGKALASEHCCDQRTKARTALTGSDNSYFTATRGI